MSLVCLSGLPQTNMLHLALKEEPCIFSHVTKVHIVQNGWWKGFNCVWVYSGGGFSKAKRGNVPSNWLYIHVHTHV